MNTRAAVSKAMANSAAVLTDKGTGAVSVIALFGGGVREIVYKIFTPSGRKSRRFRCGGKLLGHIKDRSGIVDEVLVSCLSDNHFRINCHGNPLIVADIMELLAGYGVKSVSAEKLLAGIYRAEKNLSSIAIEARIFQAHCTSIRGTRLVMNQAEEGLNRLVQQWHTRLEDFSLPQIRAGVEEIFHRSEIAGLIIGGVKLLLAGPVNTGKSSLLNRLSGREKSIVTNLSGTTRDRVEAESRFGELAVLLIDSAGLDETLRQAADAQAQAKTLELIREVDLIVVVLDISQGCSQITGRLSEVLRDKKVLTVLNKCDLPAHPDISQLPGYFSGALCVSAGTGAGIEALKEKILSVTGVNQIALHQPIFFTPRQESLLKQLSKAESKKAASAVITELLNGRLFV